MKRYLFVMRRLPHVSNHVQETLDQLLTTAAFDQDVCVLFVDDGVLQLKYGQNPAASALKDTAAIFKALSIYDVDSLYVESESLLSRGLSVEDLMLPVQVIKRIDVNALIGRQDVIVSD